MINIAEILKDCPKGMELDCTIWDNVVLAHVDINSKYPIWIKKMEGEIEFLTEYGCFNFDCSAKCVIFPKGKTTWEGFVPPCKFKDGDIVVTKTSHNFIFYSIYKGVENREVLTYVDYHLDSNRLMFNDNLSSLCFIDEIVEQRFATEEEKAKLFDAIKDNGYKWNEELNTLEMLITPKFKVGNIVVSKINQYKYTIADIKKDGYIIYYGGDKLEYYGSDKLEYHVPFCNENDFNLVSDNFDIDTLKPFDKVLARCSTSDKWRIQFFEKYDRTSIYPFICMGYNKYKQCVPYEGNEHLLDTNNNCG